VLHALRKHSKWCQPVFKVLPRLGLPLEARVALERFQKQKEIDDKLKAEYNSSAYTLEDPLVVLNPYGIASLSALLMFDTPEKSVVSICVVGNSAYERV